MLQMKIKKGELFSLLLFSLACRCFCQPFLNYTLPWFGFDVVVNSESGEVFVALGSSVIRLNSRLELLEEIFDGYVGRLAISPNNDWLIGCGKDLWSASLTIECFV